MVILKEEHILKIIRGPHLTEKSQSIANLKQLVFRVLSSSTKKEIKAAVEQLLEVKVIAVNIVNVNGKSKRFGTRIGSRKDYKKAYISLDKSVDIQALISQDQA